MINFKEIYHKSLLKEKVAWQQSLSKLLFDTRERFLLRDIKIPLSTPIQKRIWPETPRTTVFHLTDPDGVNALIKIEGTKKSISTAANIEHNIIGAGIKTYGGIVVELEGDVLIAAADDIMSQPDKTGRRWIQLSDLQTLVPRNKMATALGAGGTFEKDAISLCKELLLKYSEEKDIETSIKMNAMRNIASDWEGMVTLPGKKKSLLIKDYIDGMEKIMKLHSKPLKKLFYNYLVKRDKAGKDRLWDEIVVNNIKIKMLHSSEHGDWLEDTGYSFKTYGWEDGELVDMDQGNIEIAAYITKKSQELARKK